MTWIVGYNTPFGFGYLVSDVQVSYKVDGKKEKHKDCCQKIYPLTDSIVGGFAGSVKIGFNVIEHLRQELDKIPENHRGLDEISKTLIPEIIRKVFEGETEEEKDLGCEIILASAHPTENFPGAPWPMTHIVKFSASRFEPIELSSEGVLSIGSGSNYYREELEKFPKGYEIFKAVSGETGKGIGVGGYGIFLNNHIRKVFEGDPKEGISPSYQLMSFEPGKIETRYVMEIPKRGRASLITAGSGLSRSYSELMDYLSKDADEKIGGVVC